MSGVDQDLMRIYGTEKAASLGAYARLAMGVLNAGAEKARQNQDEQRRAAAEEMNAQFQQIDVQRMRAATQQAPLYLPEEGTTRLAAAIGAALAQKTASFPDLRAGIMQAAHVLQPEAGAAARAAAHTPLPRVGQAAYRIPARTAVPAPHVTAPPHPSLPPPTAPAAPGGGLGVKGHLALGAGAVGSVALGGHLLNKARGTMESPIGPAVYGGGPRGFQPAYGVNQYGTPQVGTSL